MSGFTDKPASTLEDDRFKITKYINGLTGFILECNTPMTIAIQGDWGSGKTSMMNMIKEQLRDQVVTSWFNTWQYSQFNMGDALAVSFLARLLSDLVTEEDKKEGRDKKIKKMISLLAKSVVVIAAGAFAGDVAAEQAKEMTKPKDEKQEEKAVDLPQVIKELKDQFQAAVNNKIEQEGKKNKRLVIFVDDLDRLHPGKAVELLEVLKLFLDCENCVFVLAIDYAVVSQGVKQKYGELIGEEKGKSFFDKIIQVPFKMPVAQYNVENYVSSSLKALGLPVSDAEVKSYVELIQCSIGCNPRAMKRLFNAFLLLNKIAAQSVTEENQKKTLFAILCLQLSFENIYNYIVFHDAECTDGNLLQVLKDKNKYMGGSDDESMARKLNLNSETDINKAVAFMEVFYSVLDQDNDGDLSEAEKNTFIDILNISKITSNSSADSGKSIDKKKDYRYINRETVKTINKQLGPQWKVHSPNVERDGFKLHYAYGDREFKTPDGKATVILTFKIETDLRYDTDSADNYSTLIVQVDFVDKTKQGDLKEALTKWCKEQTYGFSYDGETSFSLKTERVLARDQKAICKRFLDILRGVSNDIESILKKLS